MLNGRVMLFGILCVLFVTAAFGQEPSDPNIITVTKQIDVAKLNENVEDLNKNVKTLTDTLGKLNENMESLTTTVRDLEKAAVRIDERTKGILGWQYAIFGVMGAIFASMVVFFFTQWIPSQKKIKNESETTSTITAQANESDTASTNPAQLDEPKTASTSTASSRFPEGKELKEYLKSDSFTTKEKV